MLSRVRRDKTFASVVQQITIYYSTEELRNVDRFHNGVIVEALKALTNLCSFSWVGNGFPIVDILDELPACCPKLQEISITYVWFALANFEAIFAYRILVRIEDTIDLEYSSLPPPPAGLKSILYLYDPAAYVEDSSFDHSNHLNDLVGASESTIGSLSICSEPLWRIPVRVLENLSHLEIFLGHDMENVTLVFHYAGRLEHLSVLGLDDHAIFSIFEDHPDSLPSLRSFKILSPYRGWQADVDIEESQLLSIARFLRGKKLRALDIHLWFPEWTSLQPLWDLLKQLPSLEVLGVTTRLRVFARDDFLDFARALPPKLSALRVNTEWDIRGVEENNACHSFVRALSLFLVLCMYSI